MQPLTMMQFLGYSKPLKLWNVSNWILPPLLWLPRSTWMTSSPMKMRIRVPTLTQKIQVPIPLPNPEFGRLGVESQVLEPRGSSYVLGSVVPISLYKHFALLNVFVSVVKHYQSSSRRKLCSWFPHNNNITLNKLCMSMLILCPLEGGFNIHLRFYYILCYKIINLYNSLI